MKTLRKLIVSTGVQLVGYGLGTIGAGVMLFFGFFAQYWVAAIGLAVLCIGAYVTTKGEDLEP